MKQPRLAQLLLFASVLYFLIAGAYKSMHDSRDFVPVYTGASCLLDRCDPYDTHQLSAEFRHRGGNDPEFLQQQWPPRTPPVYPPASFVTALPVALFRFPIAKFLWFLLNAGLFLAATKTVLDSCPEDRLWLAVLLSAYFLIKGSFLLKSGQPAGFATSTLILGCLLIWRGKRPILASCFLCLSLAMKPQMGGLVALFLLLRKGTRVYVAAAMAGAVLVLLAGAAVLQLNPVDKDWVSELRQSISSSVLPGHINDPAAPEADQVNLGTLTAILVPDASAARYTADALSLVLIATWAFILFRSRADDRSTQLLLLGSLVVYTLLPVYHRNYDTPILLLTVPPILVIVKYNNVLGYAIALLTVFTSLPILPHMIAWLKPHSPAVYQKILGSKFLFVVMLRSQNVAIFAVFCLYLVAMFSLSFAKRPAQELATA